jgi:hypothetical protein
MRCTNVRASIGAKSVKSEVAGRVRTSDPVETTITMALFRCAVFSGLLAATSAAESTVPTPRQQEYSG